MVVRVGVPAPSWRGHSEAIQRGLHVLRSAGLEPVVGAVTAGRPNFTSPYNQSVQRLCEFESMLRRPDLTAIWCLDGGAGASALLRPLHEAFRRDPWDVSRPVIGYSDNSYLLMYLASLGHPCFYAPPVYCDSDQAVAELELAVNQLQSGQWRTKFDVEVLREGSCDGVLFGGTLSVLRALAGSKFCTSLENKILFFEEHGNGAPGQGEYLMWDSLQELGLRTEPTQLRGVVVGHVERGGPYPTEDDLFPDLWTVLAEEFRDVGGPIVSGFPFGSAGKGQVVPINRHVEISAREMRLLVDWGESPSAVLI